MLENKESIQQEGVDLSEKYRQRWQTSEGQAIADNILPKIQNRTPPREWVSDLKGLPYLDEVEPHEDEPLPRDLRGFDFTHQDLTRAEFLHCHLDYAIFEKSTLDHAHMRGSSLRYAICKRASLHKTHLWNANLQHTNFAYASLMEADLGDADLQYADLWWARLNEANLRGANLSNANLQWARLPMADLWGANLTGAVFEGTNLDQIKINDKTDWGLEEVDIGEPFSKSLKDLFRSFTAGSIQQFFFALYEVLSSFRRSIHVFYWGTPPPLMYTEKQAKTKEDFKNARDIYRQAYLAAKDAGLSDHASWFFYRGHVCRRHYSYKKWSAGWLLDYLVFDCISGYGEKPRWVIGTMINVVLFFGVLNWIGGIYGGLIYLGEEFRDIGFLGGLYFSIETFTTVGYGDISPNHHSTIGRILRFADAFESLLGNLLMALALVTYTRISIRE